MTSLVSQTGPAKIWKRLVLSMYADIGHYFKKFCALRSTLGDEASRRPFWSIPGAALSPEFLNIHEATVLESGDEPPWMPLLLQVWAL